MIEQFHQDRSKEEEESILVCPSYGIWQFELKILHFRLFVDSLAILFHVLANWSFL